MTDYAVKVVHDGVYYRATITHKGLVISTACYATKREYLDRIVQERVDNHYRDLVAFKPVVPTLLQKGSND